MRGSDCREGKKFLTEKWRITIPVVGFDFTIREKFEVQGATVETHPNTENAMEPMISVIVDGDRESARATGTALIDRITARLSFSSEKEIRLKKEVYLTQLQPEMNRQKKGWGYHDYSLTIRKTATVGDPHSTMVRFVRELEDVRQEKQDIISKAAAYYREALATANPFQEIITLFSSIQAIVQDVCGDTKGSSICKVLQDFVNLDLDECDCYYHNYRSAADHGGKHILDTQKTQDAMTKAVKIRKVTFDLVREYAKQNRRQQQI